MIVHVAIHLRSIHEPLHPVSESRPTGSTSQTHGEAGPSIRLSPKVLIWAKREAGRRGVDYQTVINETLLKASA